MKLNVLLGLQWGDEGKGKIVDYLAPKYDIIARFQGGPNAGHTLEFEGNKHILHQIPSGIFRSDIINIIGNGIVLDPIILQKEIKSLKEKFKLDVRGNLHISKKAHLILPSHRLLDAAYEKEKGLNKIGSTLKGIGPAYEDKIARLGLRVGDISDKDFSIKYQTLVDRHINKLNYLNYDFDLHELQQQFFEAIDFLRNYTFIDAEYQINNALANGRTVLAEGAQGTLLDVDFGSYPFVTSSNTSAAGACTGLGIAPQSIGEVFGIFKAYCTRVGSGPFPTELSDETGEELRKTGNEFGATTGRPRRCGWLDLPALKYSVMINGVTQLFMMKADVLNNFKEINVCTHYELDDGTILDQVPFDLNTVEIRPKLKTLNGWQKSLDDVHEFEQFPSELLDYIHLIEDYIKVPVKIVSVGPDRKQTIVKDAVLV